ncbi:MAG: hypothetical protein M1334_02255 [Patescibacteria group bacterium]|nr:hypothetical protein [Patescibacteria group bacterium]
MKIKVLTACVIVFVIIFAAFALEKDAKTALIAATIASCIVAVFSTAASDHSDIEEFFMKRK